MAIKGGLKPGDVVVYCWPEGKDSHGSMAVIQRVYKQNHKDDDLHLVDVNWISITGYIKNIDNFNYHERCFEKIGEVEQ
jgi:hypothetical protein